MATRVKITATGTVNRTPIEWPQGWPIPRVGDNVAIPGLPEVTNVRVVEWLPHGDDEGDSSPYVYIVVGPARR